MRRTLRCVAFVVCSASFLTACTPLQNALWEAGSNNFKLQTTLPNPPNPELAAMRVMVEDSAFWMHQIRTDKDTREQAWMTPAGEIIRLSEQGRISATFGSAYADWSKVQVLHAPSSWTQVRDDLLLGKRVQYHRSRDVSPGGFANIQEQITVTQLKQAPSVNFLLPVDGNTQLHWFEEHAQLRDASGRLASLPKSQANNHPFGQPLPPARFAVAFGPGLHEQVVYSEQCLSHAVCLRMQRWTPTPTTP